MEVEEAAAQGEAEEAERAAASENERAAVELREAIAARESAVEEHKDALRNFERSTAEVKQASDANTKATQRKQDTNKEKNNSPHPDATARWKAAVKECKATNEALAQAELKRGVADEARKEAWQRVVAARTRVSNAERAAGAASARHVERSLKARSIIKPTKQALEGLQPWPGGPEVTNVRLPSGKLPPMDGAPVTATDGRSVPLEPPLRGVLALVAGTGGMKTVRTLDWLQRPVDARLEEPAVKWSSEPRRFSDGSRRHCNDQLPFVFVTSRINLATKLEKDLAQRCIDVRNYNKPPSGTSVESWLRYPRLIVSVEQVHSAL